MANEVLIKTASVSLDWNDVPSATKYQCQISSLLDFTAPEYDDDTLAASATSHTLTGGVGKYFWRWRPYIVTWQKWREVSSFIYNSSISVAVSASTWKFVNKSDVTDAYTFEEYIKSASIIPEHYHRAITRNRAGTMLDEWYATKASITLDISRHYLGENEKAELLRFHNAHTAFYLVTRENNQTNSDYVYHAWEVLFTKPPQLNVPGGNKLELEEV